MLQPCGIFSQFFGELFLLFVAMVETEGVEKGVEGGAVVAVAQMAEFVQDYVVAEFLGESDQVNVEVYVV